MLGLIPKEHWTSTGAINYCDFLWGQASHQESINQWQVVTGMEAEK